MAEKLQPEDVVRVRAALSDQCYMLLRDLPKFQSLEGISEERIRSALEVLVQLGEAREDFLPAHEGLGAAKRAPGGEWPPLITTMELLLR